MNNRNVKVVDEHSIDRNANVMFAFDLEGSKYVTYWIERDEDNGNIFVSKVIKNIDGTFNMLDIDDSMEKTRLSDIVKILITTAVNNEADKLEGTSLTLADGKIVKFMVVSFNKEQRINVQKTYITTVKKEVTRVAEKYYDVELKVEEPKIFEDIFPTVTPVLEPVQEEVLPELSVPNVEEFNVVTEETPVVAPVITEPVLSTPTVNVSEEVKPNDNILVENETTIPKVEDAPEVEASEPIPTVVESITVAEPTVNVVTPEPVNVLPVSDSTPVIEPVASPSVVPEPTKVESQPLVFNAAKETNLNAALGEVASSASIPVEKIEPIREFGVDEVVKTPVNDEPAVPEPVQPQGNVSPKAGFANSKFFIVVAVAFFLASCIFLGYEVFNYFQLIK